MNSSSTVHCTSTYHSGKYSDLAIWINTMHYTAMLFYGLWAITETVQNNLVLRTQMVNLLSHQTPPNSHHYSPLIWWSIPLHNYNNPKLQRIALIVENPDYIQDLKQQYIIRIKYLLHSTSKKIVFKKANVQNPNMKLSVEHSKPKHEAIFWALHRLPPSI